MSFSLEKTHGNARAGFLTLPGWNGQSSEIKTPAFMPVGTYGAVKTILPEELKSLGTQMILSNTYHLYLRPGHRLIEKLGGLHRFMDWSGPILTDSGGFQVFSLAQRRKITDQSVTFQSHLDGSFHEFTPELSMEVQRALGSDIVMAFDECPAYPSSEEELLLAMKRTKSWAERGLEVPLQSHQLRFGIVQGGLSPDLRRQSASEITSLPFDGFALGGFAIGEPIEMTVGVLQESAPLLPKDKPRYLMGMGRPEDLIEAVRRGIDLFDCVIPSRNGRNGQLFTENGKINIRNQCYAQDSSPVEEDPDSPIFSFSRAYLRHLQLTGEQLGARLCTLHNLYFYQKMMRQIRSAILENQFDDWAKNFYTKYKSRQNDANRTKEFSQYS